MLRGIRNILYFREDISPFLIHLTKSAEVAGRELPADFVLKHIISRRRLAAGENPISDARFGIEGDNAEQVKSEYCRAVSFTETPLSEIHCLLEILERKEGYQLEPYGLVFLKYKLRKKGVSPVLYLNNENSDKMEVIKALCQLIGEESDDAARQILPLISSFGKRLREPEKNIDFLWEREWRYPNANGDFRFNRTDVFVGICPDDEIRDFEKIFPGVKFIDCQRNIKYYAKKLVDTKKRFPNFKPSVV